MTPRTRTLWFAAAISCCLFAAAWPAAEVAGDNLFFQKIAEGGMAEVDSGRLALGKASDAGVKDFASMMVNDHTKAGGEIAALARTRSVVLPAELDSEHKDAKARLQGLSGAAFDREYLRQQVAAHQETVTLLQKEAAAGKDPEVKAWAVAALPTVQSHLRRAQQLAAALPPPAPDAGAHGAAQGKPQSMGGNGGGHSSHSGASLDTGSAGPGTGSTGTTNGASGNGPPDPDRALPR